MIVQFSIILALAVALVVLVHNGLLQVDLSFPWLVAIVLLGLASLNPEFVSTIAVLLGILYPPVAVILIVIFLMLGIIVALSLAVTRLRQRQIGVIRYLAATELVNQEAANEGRREMPPFDRSSPASPVIERG